MRGHKPPTYTDVDISTERVMWAHPSSRQGGPDALGRGPKVTPRRAVVG